MRGVLREVLAIAGWVAGIFLAMNYSAVVAEHIPLESIGWLPRVIIAAVLIVVACLFVVGLLSAIFGVCLKRRRCALKTALWAPFRLPARHCGCLRLCLLFRYARFHP